MASTVIGSGLPGPRLIAGVSIASKGLKLKQIGKSPIIVSDATVNGVYTGAYMAERMLNTQSSYGGVFQGGTVNVDFKLTGPDRALDLATLMGYYLEYRVVNTDAVNALTLLPAVYSLNQLQIVIDGDSKITFNSARQIERRMIQAMPQAEFASQYAIYGYPNATFGTGGVTIPASGSRIFRIPMHHIVAFLSQHPCVQSITSEVRFRFTFQPGSAYRFSTSLSTSMEVDLMQMNVIGHVLDPAATAVLIDKVRESNLVLPAIFPILSENRFGNITGDARTGKWVFNQRGWASQIGVDIWGAAIALPQDVIAQLASYQQFWFYDSSSQVVNNLTTYNYQLYSLNSQIYGASSPPTVLPRTVADGSTAGFASSQYVDVGPNLPFCDEIVAILDDKKRFGSYALRGSESVDIQAPAAGYADLTIAVYLDLLATVTQNSEGRLQFSKIN